MYSSLLFYYAPATCRTTIYIIKLITDSALQPYFAVVSTRSVGSKTLILSIKNKLVVVDAGNGRSSMNSEMIFFGVSEFKLVASSLYEKCVQELMAVFSKTNMQSRMYHDSLQALLLERIRHFWQSICFMTIWYHLVPFGKIDRVT